MGRKMPEEDVRKIFRKFNYFIKTNDWLQRILIKIDVDRIQEISKYRIKNKCAGDYLLQALPLHSLPSSYPSSTYLEFVEIVRAMHHRSK